MNAIITVIIAVLSSGFIAAIVSALIQKRNEKEQRIFNAKLEAYKEFAAHLESKFVSLTKVDQDLDITTLAEVSAKCLLISSESINKEIKIFLVHVSEVYKRCSEPDYDEFKEQRMFDKLWKDADKIEGLMRGDLGFK